MLENPFKMPKFAMSLEMMASIIRKQHSFVLSENLDNSQYVRMKAEVVRPIVYYCIHPISVGWVTLYTYWCELISFFYIQVVQNLQIKNDSVRTFFVPENIITESK